MFVGACVVSQLSSRPPRGCLRCEAALRQPHSAGILKAASRLPAPREAVSRLSRGADSLEAASRPPAPTCTHAQPYVWVGAGSLEAASRLPALRGCLEAASRRMLPRGGLEAVCAHTHDPTYTCACGRRSPRDHLEASCASMQSRGGLVAQTASRRPRGGLRPHTLDLIVCVYV